MAKKCKYYIDIYKSESALRKLRKFHVLKVFNLRRVQACTVYMLSLLICTHHACHTCRDGDYCSKQRLGTSHAIIATYHGSVKKWNVFIYSESIFPVQPVLSKYFRVLSDIGLTEFQILSDRTKFCRTKLFKKPIVKLCSVLFSIT